MKLIEFYNLTSDVSAVQKVMSGYLVPSSFSYNDHSMIYRSTNENISNEKYVEALKDKERVLSITSSGDQIINSILFGAKQIVGIDICRFSKYYTILKLAAIKSLSKEEFLDYIVGIDNKLPLSRKLYKKIRRNLSQEALIFWDSIFDFYNEEQVINSKLFGDYKPTKERVVKNNPFLQDDNYEKVKENLKDIDIRFVDGDIFNCDTSSLGQFDLVLLSNIYNYIEGTGYDPNITAKYERFLEELPLSKNGIAVTYNFIFNGYLTEKFSGENFRIHPVKENIISGDIENEIMIYKKKKKHLFFRK